MQMFRKFLLVAGLALLPQGSTAQLLLAIMVSFAHLVLLLNFAPFRKQDVDYTSQGACRL